MYHVKFRFFKVTAVRLYEFSKYLSEQYIKNAITATTKQYYKTLFAWQLKENSKFHTLKNTTKKIVPNVTGIWQSFQFDFDINSKILQADNNWGYYHLLVAKFYWIFWIFVLFTRWDSLDLVRSFLPCSILSFSTFI